MKINVEIAHGGLADALRATLLTDTAIGAVCADGALVRAIEALGRRAYRKKLAPPPLVEWRVEDLRRTVYYAGYELAYGRPKSAVKSLVLCRVRIGRRKP